MRAWWIVFVIAFGGLRSARSIDSLPCDRLAKLNLSISTAPWDDASRGRLAGIKVRAFCGVVRVFDGGSIVYQFLDQDGAKFTVRALAQCYWTEQEKHERSQVYVISFGQQTYKIDPNSEEEGF